MLESIGASPQRIAGGQVELGWRRSQMQAVLRRLLDTREVRGLCRCYTKLPFYLCLPERQEINRLADGKHYRVQLLW